MPSDVSLGEVSRKLDELSKDVKSMSATLGERPSWKDINRVEKGLADRIEALELQVTKELVELKDWQTWAKRLILGAVVVAVITGLIAFKP